MPNLPRLPRPRLRRPNPAGDADAPGIVEVDDPRVIEAAGLRWIHIEDPRLAHREWLEQHYDFRPLDWEDVYSRNQRATTLACALPGCRQRADPSQTPRATTVVRNA